jgi:pyocin large subunit-like protein
MKVNQNKYGIILKHLMRETATAHTLAEVSSMHLITVQSLMKSLLEHDVVYVSAWEQDTLGRDATPIYKLGKEESVSRAKLTQAERTERYKMKKQLAKEKKTMDNSVTQ